MRVSLDTKDKPCLERLLKEDRQAALEIMNTFAELMEEAAANEWYKLPKMFTPDGSLKFKDLVKGILHGCLDLRGINPDMVDVLKEEVHPLSMLAPRRDYLEGTVRYVDWRKHFRLSPDTRINQETIAQIFRRLLRYYKYVDVEALARALINRQVKTFEGLGERNVQTLPFMPALRYQQAKFGDLQVGLFFDDIGAFDCGSWPGGPDLDRCPACGRPDLQELDGYVLCLACNAGFKTEA